MRKKVLFLLADGFETVEAITPANFLRRAAIEVTLCSTREKNLIVPSNTSISVVCDIDINDVDPVNYDMLFIPGGDPGYKNLLSDPRVLDLIRRFDGDGKWLAAICAAPLVLQKAGVLRDRRHTSYPDLRDKFDPQYYSEDLIVRDRKLLTARGPVPAVDFSFAIIEALTTERVANILKEKTLYRESLEWMRI